jgi:hypothetical protein
MDWSARGLLQARWEDTAMQRTMGVYSPAANLLVHGVPASVGSSTPALEADAAGHADRLTACGVGWWAVKTGINPDARLVNQKVVIPTNIAPLHSLPAPTSLPLYSRLRRVEMTAWALDAVLLRYKVEADADVHLVSATRWGVSVLVL